MSDQDKKQPTVDATAQAAANRRPDRGARDHKGRRRHNEPGRPLDESVNMDELRQIVELIAEHGFTDFELENKDVRVRLRRELAPQIVSMQSAPPPATELQTQAKSGGGQASGSSRSSEGTSGQADSVAPPVETPVDEDEDLHMITSPIVGTFFRSPSPTADPFVKLGSHISADTIVCIIEAMKLMNEIQSDTAGVVAKIYVENGQPVEYGQPLFGIKN